jgi:hypothetical protein
MAGASFSPIKKALAKHNRESLVALVGELYALSPQNRDFLDARFVEGDSALQRYKRSFTMRFIPTSCHRTQSVFVTRRRLSPTIVSLLVILQGWLSSRSMPLSAEISLPAILATSMNPFMIP